MANLHFLAMVESNKIPLVTKAIEVVAGFTPVVRAGIELDDINVDLDKLDKNAVFPIETARSVIRTIVWMTDEYEVKEKEPKRD